MYWVLKLMKVLNLAEFNNDGFEMNRISGRGDLLTCFACCAKGVLFGGGFKFRIKFTL